MNDFIPCLDILEEYLRDGFYIAFQDGACVLFQQDGDLFVSGITLREMLINLILADGSVETIELKGLL